MATSESILRQKVLSAKRYRDKINPVAEKILKQLLASLPDENLHQSVMNILIIGAGNFPSYFVLLNELQLTFPKLNKVNFHLLEPTKSDTDFFIEYFSNENSNTLDSLKIEFIIHSLTLKDFLLGEGRLLRFDLLYFEHPETFIFPVLLGKLGWQRFQKFNCFRESIPYLANVIKKNTIILCVSMSLAELKQLQGLLHFSLSLKTTKKVSALKNILYGGPYSVGTCHIANPQSSKSENIIKKISLLRKSDTLLLTFIISALFIYIFYCSQYADEQYALVRLICIALFSIQLYSYQPGKKGILIQLCLISSQILIYLLTPFLDWIL